MTAVHPKYRADIDGLRAVAVLLVVAFHAFPNWVKGGFVGVDVFFVISGYLISTIIFSNLENGTFSYGDFYARRVKRIFPALSLVLATVFALGWLRLKPLDTAFSQLGEHMAAGAGFVSNIVLWRESGYFDTASESKPLLHLWSLAIEEQFYIFWPLLLGIVHRGKWNFLTITLLIASASFGLNVLTVGSDPTAAFYSPLSRFWELMIGGLLAYLTLRKDPRLSWRPDWLSTLGLAAIAASGLLLSGRNSFPGWWALLPSAGAFLVISAGPGAWLNRRVLSNRALVGIGLVSYPLYLWHWPALYAVRHFGWDATSAQARTAKLAAVGVSLILSWLTYKLAETPIRLSKRGAAPAWALSAVMLCLGLAGYAASRGTLNGLRFSPPQRDAISRLQRVKDMQDLKKMYGERPCFIHDQKNTARMFLDHDCFEITRPGRPVVFVVGDSLSASLSLGLKPFVERQDMNFAQSSSGWCELTIDDLSKTWCRDINDLTLKKIAELKPDVVVFSANWVGAARPPFFVGAGRWEDALLAKLSEMRMLGAKKIIVVGQIPIWSPSLPSLLYENFVARSEPIPRRTLAGVDPESLAMDARMRALRYPAGVTYRSMKDAFCDARGCLTAVGDDLGRDAVVWDSNHMSVSASRWFADEHLGPAAARLAGGYASAAR